MNNSGNATSAAPSALACARAARALSALPAMSPTVGIQLAERDLEGWFRSWTLAVPAHCASVPRNQRPPPKRL